MRHLMIALIFALITTKGITQTYSVITAKKSGSWSNVDMWDTVPRVDGKNLTSVIIPANISVTVDTQKDLSSFGEMELEISGILEIKANQFLRLSEASKIVVKQGGIIDTDAKAKDNKTKKNNKQNEQIYIGPVVKFDAIIDGRISGNVKASSLTGTSPMGFSLNAVLPVNFVAFTAIKVDDKFVGLTWTTADEINNSHFEIQRSEDGSNFKSIALVLPVEDNSNTHLYKYNDKYTVHANVYYRIRQVDIDGKDKYSPVRTIAGTKSVASANVYVSSRNTVTVDLKNNGSNVMVRMISMNGIVIGQKTKVSDARVSLTAYNAAPGAYVVQVSDKTGLLTSKRVLL